jgi:cytochrome P450
MKIDLTAPERIADPFPGYEEVRAEGDVVWNETMNTWMVPSDRLCREILSDFSHYVLDGTLEAFLFGENAFIAIDDKTRHDELRDVWISVFQPSSLGNLSGIVLQIVQQLIAPLSHRLRDGEAVDVASVFCRSLPVLVISELLGIAPELRPRMVKWTDDMVAAVEAHGDTAAPQWIAAEVAQEALAQCLYEQIEYRRAHPESDLISRLVQSTVGKRLSPLALMENCRLLMFAGNETTAKWLAQAIFILGKHPASLREVVSNPALIPAALEEVMRWETITQITERKVRGAPAMIGDKPMQDGETIHLLIGAANRDPARYSEPASFDIHRERKSHLGFGHGLHTCVGAPLARLEAKIALSEFLKNFGDYQVEGEPIYTNFMGRWPDAVPIRLN